MRTTAIIEPPLLPKKDFLFCASTDTLGVNLETFARLGVPPMMLCPISKKEDHNRINSKSPPSRWQVGGMVEGLTGSVEDPKQGDDGHHLEVLGTENILWKTAECLDYLMVDSPLHPQLQDIRKYLGSFFAKLLNNRFNLKTQIDLTSATEESDEKWYALMTLITGRYLDSPSKDPSVSKVWTLFTTPVDEIGVSPAVKQTMVTKSKKAFWHALYVLGEELASVTLHSWNPKSSRDLARLTFTTDNGISDDFLQGDIEFQKQMAWKRKTRTSSPSSTSSGGVAEVPEPPRLPPPGFTPELRVRWAPESPYIETIKAWLNHLLNEVNSENPRLMDSNLWARSFNIESATSETQRMTSNATKDLMPHIFEK
jgi:hypothetical protein